MTTGSAPFGRLRDESAYMLCGLWMIVGLYLDGWSHQANKPESFFTPWHALLYSGFGAAVLYSGYMAMRDARTGALPQIADDRVTTFGVVLFAIGAVGDGIWHTLVGIEVDIEGLISPTHLMLMTGGLLMVTLPIRAALARTDDRASKTVLASLTFAVGVTAFFLMYLSPFNEWWVYTRAYQPNTDVGNLAVQTGMARILVTTVLYIGPFLWAARRWSLPFGTATIAFTVISLAQSGLGGFDLGLTLLAATVGGLVLDVLLRDRRSLPLVGAASAVAMWLGYFGLLHVEETVRWSPTLWVGALVFAGVTGLACGVAVRER
jgi:hypothetical protein